MADPGQAARQTIADIPAVLTALARSQPDRPAILAPGRKPLSFADLDAQMAYVRATLANWGIGRGDPVAVLLPKGPEMAVACAVLPAAATCVPLDAGSSVEDYGRLFRRCSVRALVMPPDAEGAAVNAAERAGLMRIEVTADASAPAGRFDMDLVRRATGPRAESPCRPTIAYILCTSGTTAQRKLVPIRHDQIVGYSAAIRDVYGFTPDDLSIHVVPPHLAHGIKSALMVPLLAGTSIVCPPDFQVDAFFRLLEIYRPTWFTAGFTVHREILRAVARYRHILDGTKLRFLRSGSGRLEPDEIARLEQAFGAPVVVKLSSTETCIISINPLPQQERRPDSVGRPVANDVAIRGDDGALLGPDHEGEIVVRGPLVFDGYIDDPAANEQAFVDGWYRTGDLGKFDADGFLYLTGRIKDIINRGGEKISPAEIDAVLETHPAVADAAAFGVPHPTLGELVVAAVVPRAGARPDEGAIRRHARSRLAPVKVPSRIFFVDRLPRSENGKLQRAQLRETVAVRLAHA